MKFKNASVQKWVTLIVVAIGRRPDDQAALPERNVYGAAGRRATGATKTQLGMLMSAYGIVNFICYFPGGILADKFSAKSLIVVSCFGTAWQASGSTPCPASSGCW